MTSDELFNILPILSSYFFINTSLVVKKTSENYAPLIHRKTVSQQTKWSFWQENRNVHRMKRYYYYHIFTPIKSAAISIHRLPIMIWINELTQSHKNSRNIIIFGKPKVNWNWSKFRCWLTSCIFAKMFYKSIVWKMSIIKTLPKQNRLLVD